MINFLDDLALQEIFLEFENRTLKLRLRSKSKIYELFKTCLGNWRFLVTVKNYSELNRKLEIFITTLVNEFSNPYFYRSKKEKYEYFRFLQNVQSILN